MPGISSVLHTALRSMEVSAQSLAVASNNIANEKTPGYSKQRLLLEAAPTPEGRIRIGNGVNALGVESLRDELLERRLREERSNKSGEESLYNTLSDIESIFNDAADAGMLPVITEFFNSFHSLALDPSSVGFREQVKAAAESLITNFDSRAEELRRIQAVADQNVSSEILTINQLAGNIATLSGRIRASEAAGQMANDLRDRRGQLVGQLSESLNVQELENGSDYKLMVGGALLVYDGESVPVTADTSSGFTNLKVGSIDVQGSITSGKIAAWTEARDVKIPGYITQLDQLAYEISQEVNTLHSAGYTPAGATGINFFTPLGSATDAARQLALSSNIAASVNDIAAAASSGGADNDNATALGNLLHSPTFTGGSVIDQYRSLVFQIGTDTTGSKARVDQYNALYHQLQDRRDSSSGVSVDEETMRILQFQRAYQASANVMQVADELIQTLLGLVR